jgi:hypothetical protein
MVKQDCSEAWEKAFVGGAIATGVFTAGAVLAALAGRRPPDAGPIRRSRALLAVLVSLANGAVASLVLVFIYAQAWADACFFS